MINEFKQFQEKLLKSKSYLKEISKIDLPFEIAESIIDARIRKGMTQEQLASKIKTAQPAIARLENGNHYPNFKTLEKVAKVLEIKMRNPLVSGYEETPIHIYHFLEVVNNGEVSAVSSSNVSEIIKDFS